MYQLNQVPSEAQIRKFLRRTLFGKSVFCPQCRSRKVVRYEGRYRCRVCHAPFSLLSHTWLRGHKLSLQKFWLLLWAWCTAVPVKQAASLSSLSEEAVRRWYGRFRTHLPEEPVILEKIVQLDEAYFQRWALMMAKQEGTRRVAYALLKGDPARYHAAFFLRQHVKPRSRLRTDGSSIYRTIDQWWPVRHETDLHAKWEFGKTSEIERLFGNLRTFIRRMYHHASPEKLPDYVREFSVRFSSPELFENPRNYLKKTLSLVPID